LCPAAGPAAGTPLRLRFIMSCHIGLPV